MIDGRCVRRVRVMTGGDGFVLGVDFGTSNTVAMLRRPDGRVTPLLFDGTPGAAVGGVRRARTGPVRRPRRAAPRPAPPGRSRAQPEATHRRRDGAAQQCSSARCPTSSAPCSAGWPTRRPGSPVTGPATLVLSHPAGWGPVRRLTLSDAAAAVGLPHAGVRPRTGGGGDVLHLGAAGQRPVRCGRCWSTTWVPARSTSPCCAPATSFEVLGSDGLDDVGGLDVDGPWSPGCATSTTTRPGTRLSRPTTPDGPPAAAGAVGRGPGGEGDAVAHVGRGRCARRCSTRRSR